MVEVYPKGQYNMENARPPRLPDQRCVNLARIFIEECRAPENVKEDDVISLAVKMEKTIDDFIHYIRSVRPYIKSDPDQA
jgi:hypothetical protein